MARRRFHQSECCVLCGEPIGELEHKCSPKRLKAKDDAHVAAGRRDFPVEMPSPTVSDRLDLADFFESFVEDDKDYERL